MNRRRLLFLSVLVVALLVSGCGLWAWQAKRQYALNKQLIAALLRNDHKAALALVNAGADPNTRKEATPAPTLPQLLRQLLHRLPVHADDSPTAFLFACGANWGTSNIDPLYYDCLDDVKLVGAMLMHGAEVRETRNFNTSALHCATASRYTNVVRLLLEHGAKINAQDEYGRTPLMHAVGAMNTRLTCLLLEHGASVSLTDDTGANALHYAVAYGTDQDILRVLLAHGADPNRKNIVGITPLTMAQAIHRPDIVALLQKGAK